MAGTSAGESEQTAPPLADSSAFRHDLSGNHPHVDGDHAHTHEAVAKAVTPEWKDLRIDELRGLADEGLLSKEDYYAEVTRRNPQALTVEDELPPEYGLFVQLGLHTRIPLLGHEALANFTFAALEEVQNLRIRLVNTSVGIGVADVPTLGFDLAGVNLAKGEQLVVPVAVIPTALGESRVTWEVTALVRGKEIDRRATIIVYIDPAIERSTLHQEVSSLAPPFPARDGLVTPMAAGSPAASYTGNRVSKISFVNGLDPIGEGQRDINGNWNSHMQALQGWGWSGEMGGTGWYDCDFNWAWNVEHHGDHSQHLGGRTQAENHGGDLFCDFFQPTTGTHDQDTTIEHIAYHWAWTMWDHLGPQCIKAAGHSMGGLVIRYALHRIQAGDSGFPLGLCIDDVVTLGTPHGGSDQPEPNIYDADTCAPYYYECQQMVPGSGFLNHQGQYATNPQGYGDTDWTAMGSTGDGSVTAAQATTNNFAPAHAIVYEEALEHSSAQGSFHWGNAVSGDIVANIRWTDQPLGFEATSQDAPWPSRYMDMSLAYNQWGCGVESTVSSWPLANGVTTLGEPYTTSFHCGYYMDVPADTASLDVAMTSLNGHDMDIYVRQSSPTGTLRCSAASGASSEACSVSNPSAGRYYIQVYNYAGTRDPFTITASRTMVVHDLTDTYPTSYPSSVEAGQSYSICWTVQGAGTISHTNIHYGTSSSLGSATSTLTGTAPKDSCATLTAPSSGTVYFKSHASGPNDDLYSGLYTIPVNAAQNDCGTGVDAGNSFAAATTVTLPKNNCQGQITASDAQDWYKFNVASGSTISTSMTPQSGADFDLCLYDPSGNSVGCSTAGGSNPDSVSHTATVSGNWVVQVYQYSGTGTYTLSVSSGGGGGGTIASHAPTITSGGQYGSTGTFITFDSVSGSAPITVTYKYCYGGNTNGRTAQIRTVFDGTTVNTHSFTTPYTGGATCTWDNPSTFATNTFTINSPGVSSQIKFDYTNGDWLLQVASITVTN